MSLVVFEKEVASSLEMGENDRLWFPRWIARFATFLECGQRQPLTWDEAKVIRFLRQLRDRKVKAWQRLQAVKALECYRNEILNKQLATNSKQYEREAAASESECDRRIHSLALRAGSD